MKSTKEKGKWEFHNSVLTTCSQLKNFNTEL